MGWSLERAKFLIERDCEEHTRTEASRSESCCERANDSFAMLIAFVGALGQAEELEGLGRYC